MMFGSPPALNCCSNCVMTDCTFGPFRRVSILAPLPALAATDDVIMVALL